MKLTHKHIGLEMVRIDGNIITRKPIILEGVIIQHPLSVKDFSYMAEPLKLVNIHEDGSLVLERYDPSHRSYQKLEIEKHNKTIDLPTEEGYVFLNLEANWNDEHWGFHTRENIEQGLTNSHQYRSIHLSLWDDIQPWVLPEADLDYLSISFPSQIMKELIWKTPFTISAYELDGLELLHDKEKLQGVLTSYLQETIPTICYITEKTVLLTPKRVYSVPLPSKQFRQLKEQETNKKRLKKTI